MILITDEIFNSLSEGLDGIDKIKIRDLINKFGLYEAGRILGYDVSHYNNLLMSGRLAIEDLKNRGPKNLLEYVDVMKNRLSKDTYWYIVENYRKLQDAIDRNSFKDYDHDWFSGNTMITMYSSPVVFRGQGIETPQQIWMRVAIQLYHDESVEEVIILDRILYFISSVGDLKLKVNGLLILFLFCVGLRFNCYFNLFINWSR